jgi:hypothetical protein
MDKLRATIIAVLDSLNRPLYRTEIVKFVYMIDEIYYRHFGKTITGSSYMWDNFGPNSIGDAIVNEANELGNMGIIRIWVEPNSHGSMSYKYNLEKRDINLTSILTEEEKYIIKDITCHYKNYTLDELIDASKKTESFKGVEQYQVINLKQSEKYKELINSLQADDEFMRGVEAVVKEMVR